MSDSFEKSIVVIYFLSSPVSSCNFLVSLSVHIKSSPVAMGSNVPLCQIFFSPSSLFRARIISKLLSHCGLSTAISMCTERL